MISKLTRLRQFASTARYMTREKIGSLRYDLSKRRRLRILGLAVPRPIWNEAESFVGKFIAELPDGVSGYGGSLDSLYSLVRILKPELVVETGIGNGISSAIILQALAQNRTGRLLSVDEPNLDPSAILPLGALPGWVVPTESRDKWEIIKGKTRDKLPELLATFKTIDFFYHDSEHTYNNMMFEFREAWGKLRDGGMLVADNQDLNRAFHDFVRSVECKWTLLQGVGYCRKMSRMK